MFTTYSHAILTCHAYSRLNSLNMRADDLAHADIGSGSISSRRVRAHISRRTTPNAFSNEYDMVVDSDST